MKIPALTLTLLAAGPLWAAGVCERHADAAPPAVVELYTSEGCSSCPAADRWLSTLKGRDDVLALAFHVDYWDRLGWTDRFASAAASARQRELARARRETGVYTPQVLVNGRDWRGWPALPPGRPAGTVSLALARDGQQLVAAVGPATGASAPASLSGYWAVLEDGHASRVSAGENDGATLRHDHVVRLYRPLAPWPAAQAQRFSIDVLPDAPGHARRVAFVVEDAATRVPVQALALGGCRGP
jgi:hypothetical protein